MSVQRQFSLKESPREIRRRTYSQSVPAKGIIYQQQFTSEQGGGYSFQVAEPERLEYNSSGGEVAAHKGELVLKRKRIFGVLAAAILSFNVACGGQGISPSPVPPTPTRPPTATPQAAQAPALIPALAPTVPSVATPTPGSSGAPAPTPLPEDPSYAYLPRWRGFNLVEKHTLADNQPYSQWELDTIAEWGFNFVRLPLDYHIWTVSPGVYREDQLAQIDQEISWARARKIHVSLNLHRAPGYCVNPPAEPLDLWADGPGGDEARRQFADQWRMFAARYRGIPSSDLSFNLINEPPDIEAARYVRAVAPAIAAIHDLDPGRLIIADGLAWGTKPVPELASLKVAQSTRGYAPMSVTHYRASWIRGSDTWPAPTWPVPAGLNSYLYGPFKKDFQSTLIIRTNLTRQAEIGITVAAVSHEADLEVRADGAPVLQKSFQPGPGQGEWKESVYRPQYNDYIATYDREYTGVLPAGTREIEIAVTRGDWLTYSQIRITPYPGAGDDKVLLRPADPNWGTRQGVFVVDGQGNLSAADGRPDYSKDTLWSQDVGPWKNFAAQGIGVFVGEWGAYRYTPHSVVLAWMQDNLENWRAAGMGWALWNLEGDFGPLDSDRADVVYEDYKGHKLDRQMLELLKKG